MLAFGQVVEGTELARLDRHYCVECQERYPSPGMCPEHPAEPLLDLGDEEVRELLREGDRQARLVRFGRIIGIGQLVAIPLTALVAQLIVGMLDTLFIEVVVFLIFFIYIGTLFAWTLAGTRFFPHRSKAPRLDEPEVLALQAAREAEMS